MAQIKRRRFGRTGLQVPEVTYGGGWVGGLLITAEQATAFATLDKALAAGAKVLAEGADYVPHWPLACAWGLRTWVEANRPLVVRFIRGYDDPRAYAVSHIGWGLNAACEWSVDLPGIGMDGRACFGNVLFSLGPDTEFGGENDTPCHLDLPMRNCTLTLDDEVIVDHGDVLPSDMRSA